LLQFTRLETPRQCDPASGPAPGPAPRKAATKVPRTALR